jgi:hypothetical protein
MIARPDVIRSSGLLFLKVPPLAVSLFVAETFFKFGSFTRECLTFLALWYVLDWAYEKTLGMEKS